uniref:Uncharacterized protein n=1 Tax=Triticum urartu TaxID=4572 RepID=A0A8R7TLS1_TRIUA
MGQRSRCHENCRVMTEIPRCEIKGKCEALASILRLIPANFPTELQHEIGLLIVWRGQDRKGR